MQLCLFGKIPLLILRYKISQTTFPNKQTSVMAKQARTTVVHVAEPVIEIDESLIRLPLGRPVDPESERQKRLAEYEEKRAAGLLHRGRPIDPESPSHQAKAERDAKRKAGIELHRGRPVDPESPRQKQLQKRNARLAIIRENYIASLRNQSATQNQMNTAIAGAKNAK